MPVHTTYKLSNGLDIPSIALGTWMSAPGEVEKAVKHAIECGYKHIDCAWGYGNEAEVGEGIKASGVPRDQIWITSKLFELHHKPEHVELAVRDSLKKLGTDYLDMYLLHYPVAWKTVCPDGVLPQKEHTPMVDGRLVIDIPLSEDFLSTWAAMEKLVEKGLVRSIGVSNFNIYKLKKLIAAAKIKPVANQIELSIQNPQFEFVDWLKRNQILPQAFSPLGGLAGQHLRQHPVVLEIGKKYGVHGAVVLVSWLLQRGIQPLPKSVFENEIEANIKPVDLTKEEVERLSELARSFPSKRVVNPSSEYEPFYDVYQEDHPEFSDKAQLLLEKGTA
ncbi:hypothetical protein V865_001095 [Kwoniella europaea PYCC6329]|uniref:NADP-dependent oxidoreductase domain-containing protein n=1 Tax=Kwoniella europaea PYCC6329 TaxID=1423913 RepID=A0AAX4K989_9TREE